MKSDYIHDFLYRTSLRTSLNTYLTKAADAGVKPELRYGRHIHRMVFASGFNLKIHN